MSLPFLPATLAFAAASRGGSSGTGIRRFVWFIFYVEQFTKIFAAVFIALQCCVSLIPDEGFIGVLYARLLLRVAKIIHVTANFDVRIAHLVAHMTMNRGFHARYEKAILTFDGLRCIKLRNVCGACKGHLLYSGEVRNHGAVIGAFLQRAFGVGAQ
ncbi:hypothetical protein [Roseobacter denitrificans]|uniref:hypothetical protein n=1 Tax=Roseobacter denitrificans TaxID=2434 RepID=UPI001160C1AB|nr:hypothetical protein [Roseobacter denitrificans]